MRYVWCLIVFTSGWLAGTLFVITFILNDWDGSMSNTPNSSKTDFFLRRYSGSSDQVKNSSNANNHHEDVAEEIHHLIDESKLENYIRFDHIRDTIHEITNAVTGGHGTSDTTNQKLPQFPISDNKEDDEDKKSLWIYLDWPTDDRLFSNENYLALESMMNIYPTAIFRCIIAAPTEAYSHKIGNLLSVNQFVKYKKLSYDIETHPVSKMKQGVGHISQIGKQYWSKWADRCCNTCNSKCRVVDHIQPYHVLMFIRLSKLYVKGGIFNDFSFIFLGPLNDPTVTQGYYINYQCSKNITSVAPLQIISDATRNGDRQVNRCTTSTLLVFHTSKSPAILCVLSKYDDPIFIECIESDQIYGGARCILNAFNQCFKVNGINNDLSTKASTAVLEVFQHNPDKASQSLASPNWTLNKQKRVFWLGSLAWDWKWNELSRYNSGDRNRTLLEAVSDSIHLHKLEGSSNNETKCSIICSHYSTNLKHLNSRNITSSYNAGIENMTCAPSIVLPGFMNSASTFLFEALVKHPQVLPPLIGSRMEGSQVYNTRPSQRLLKRPWSYPYVHEHEPFAIIDSTISYATDPDVPLLMKEDNSNIKAVFVVRHPVDRMYSNFKSLYQANSNIGVFNEIAEWGMRENGKFGKLRKLFTNGNDTDTIIQSYYNEPSNDTIAVDSMFMHSITYPAIAYYQKIFGNDSVYVVNADDLDVNNMKRMKDTVYKVYQFLGLCPYEFEGFDLKTPSSNITIDHEMSQEMYMRLNSFFTPFNNAVGTLIGYNATAWNTRQPSSSLPMYAFGFNTSMPSAWFESFHVSKGNRNSLLHHLLPDKKEDVSSNSTLGMLISF